MIRAATILVARGGVPSINAGAVEALADVDEGSVNAQFGGVVALLLATVATLAHTRLIEPPVAFGQARTPLATLDALGSGVRAYVDEDETRFSALVQFSSAGILSEHAYRAPVAEHHRRTREAVAAHLAVLHRAGRTGVATADLTALAALFADTSRGIEMVYLLDRDTTRRSTAYRELAAGIGRRLANAPREAAELRQPAPLTFRPNYRLQMVLEPDGVIRDLLDMEGIRGWNSRDFVGRPVNLAAADIRRDPSRDATWQERLAEARRQPGTRRYFEPAMGGDPASLDSVTTLTPIHDASGELESILVDIEDHSGTRAAEAAAFAQEEQLRNALELSRLGTYILSFREPVIVTNDRVAEIYSCDPQQVMSDGGLEGFFALIHAEDRPRVQAALDASMSGDVDFEVAHRLWVDTPDGPQLRWLNTRGRVEIDDGGPVRLLGAVEDLTERHRQQAALLQSQKRDAIGTLAAGVAHDFNNVLGAILGHASAAERRLAAGESPTHSLREIARGARRASGLVDRLLAVSRDDHTPREAYSVAAVIHEACALLRPTLGLAVELRESIADDLLVTVGDAAGLHQVILNLVVNADAAVGSEDGLIEVDADAVYLGDGDASAGYGLPAGEYVRIRVRDNGPGFASDAAERAFDPFVTTKIGEGAGLGLAAAQTVIHNQGGSITLESMVGLGSAFTIHLPAGAGAPSAPDPSTSAPSRSRHGQPPRVLFVDDERSLRDLADREMAAAGCEVVTQGDPFAALELLRVDPAEYDAVITDLAMPLMNGLGFVKHLRRFLPTIPVVLTSGYVSDDARETARRLEVGRIVPKPCTISELAVAVILLVDEHAGDRATGS